MDDVQLEKERAALIPFRQRFSQFVSPASWQAGVSMKVEQGDIFICTPARSGTTWMQQICHQLRSGTGDMDFEEISNVVPYIEGALDTDVSLDGEQRFPPRLFKSHFWQQLVPTGGRYILVVRDPYDISVSLFKFFEGWFFQQGEISLETFVTEELTKRPAPKGIFNHMASWWPRHADADVLWVFYEDMKEDLQAQVERVAAFMGIADPAVISQAVHKSTFAFMKEHEEQFSELPLKRKRNAAYGLEPDAGMGQGKICVGGGQQHLLTERCKIALDEQWREVCEPVMGAASYSDWRAAWKSS
ncbi:sulfotransferase 1C2A-like [Sycon ciliatum]|uniref:sulfotransferase 1C2A-like n=1 Tax=Sycon ciliatum TaxID=27933 RepID=UPI0031F71BDE